mgnify:CR=1 FL=1
MGSYIFQIILFQLAFLLVYEFLLKKETFFNYNRVYLLITPILAFLLPLINIEMLSGLVPQESVKSISSLWLPEVYIGEKTQSFQQLPELVLTEKSYSFNWLAIIYGIGTVVSLGILAKKFINLRRLFKFNVVSKVQNFRIIEIPASNVACTFNKTIFLGADLNNNEREQIIAHELIHIQQKHSYDLVFFEIFKILFWFNPLIYIYQNRIAALHEFIADSNVVKTIEKRSYYEQLLNTAFNTQNISFINQFFNHSLIKKRIVMLQKSKSKTIAKFKYLLMVPLLTVMLTYVSCSAQENDKISNESSISEQIDNLKAQIEEKGEINEQEKEKLRGLLNLMYQYSVDINKSQNEFAEVPFAVIDQVPIYPGCENLGNNEEQKKCMTSKISEFVGANFNTGLGKELKLVGLKRVIVQFKIDKNGEIADARARAPHPELEKEALRVINSIPKMIPGQQKGKNVGVMYSLPIAFQVENDKDAEEKN